MADKKKIGRPTVDNPKNIQMRIRLTVEENEMLTECAETLETTKSDVFIRGMRKVYDEIKKKKQSVAPTKENNTLFSHQPKGTAGKSHYTIPFGLKKGF